MKQYNLKLCPLCEAPLVRESRNVSMVYKDKTFNYLQPGEWCSGCGEGFLSAEDLALSKQERTVMRTDKEIDFLEKHIPELAESSMKKAYYNALSSGIPVLESKGYKIIKTYPDGREEFVKYVPSPVKINKKLKIDE